MTVSDTKLLPCPFCGGQPHVSTRQDEDLATHNTVVWTRVYCIECDIGFEMPPGYGREPVAQWNTRALTAALSDQAVTSGTEKELRLVKSQLAECHKEIFKLREALLAASPPASTAGDGK